MTAEDRLAESEARWRAMAEATREGVVVHEEGIIQFHNLAFAEMFGYEPGEMVGMEATRLHPPQDIPEAVARMQRPPTNQGEWVGLRKDGSRFPMSITAQMIEIRGRPHRIAVVRDLTEQRRNEQALRESNARFQLVARATNDVVYDWNITTGNIEWSDAGRTVLGVPGDPADTGIEWWRRQLHPDDRDRVQNGLDALLAAGGEAWTAEYRFARTGGGWRDILDRGLVEFGETGEPRRMIGVMADVSAYNEMKDRLALADRMAIVGTLAAGVAHEVAQPLTWVIAKIATAGEQLASLASSPRVDAARTAMDMAAEGAQRIRLIIRDLKVFSRAEAETTFPIDVRRVLDSAASIANSDVKLRAQLVRRYDSRQTVAVNEARLGQVVLNLLVNAVQAIPPGAPRANTITLATRDDGPFVVLEVSDTGTGIPPAVKARIFDAFFTTKPPGEGTGLGLAICRQLLAQMRGEIDVESEPGKGTTFRVRLPAAPLVDGPAPELPSYLEPPPRRGRVLVVDDEEMIVSFLERVIELDHDVEGETQPRAALEKLRAGARYDAILCDLMMPEVTGVEFYQALLEFAPGQAERVVFITGGAFTPRVRGFLDASRVPVIEKPFDIKRLGAAVRDLVNRPA